MILGIDPSLTGTGLAILEPGQPVKLSTIPSAPGQIEPRLLGIVGRVNAAIDTHRPDYVAIEGLSMSSNDPSAQERAALHFCIRIALHLRNVPFVVVAPMALKKFVCGGSQIVGEDGKRGPAKKEHMLKAVWKNWQIDTGDNNQADAAGLGYIAAAIRGSYTPTNQAQREVVAKLLAPPVPKKKRRKKGEL